MLQSFKSPPIGDGEGERLYDLPYPTRLSLADQVTGLIAFIRRRLPIILSALPVTLGIAVIYLYTAQPFYEGRARLMIDGEKIQVFKESILGEQAINLAMMDSQIEILKSENFALSIIKKLSLTEDPEFTNSSDGLIDKAKKIFNSTTSNQKESESEITQRAVRAFADRLTISRIPMTAVIEVAFRSTDPDRAAQMANTIADAFIDDQLEAKYETLRRAMTWLQDRLSELRGQALTAERAVIDYKAANNIVDTGGHLINDQQLTELNTDLIKARADAMETRARLDRVMQILRNDKFDPAATDMGTVTDTLHNEIITKLRQQYLDLAQREALFSNRLGHDHLAVVNIRNQMRELNRSILSELRQIAEAYKSDLNIAEAREASLEKSLAASVAGSQTTNKAQIELRQLESAAQTYRTLYEHLQQRYTEAVQQQSLPLAEARVITRASRPLGKTSPKSTRILAVATLGGIMVGLGLALMREISDRVFRTSKQIEAELKTECLALVPIIGRRVKTRTAGTKALANPDSSVNPDTLREISLSGGVCRQVVESPLSRFAEAIRAIKVGADFGSFAKRNRIIGLTSSLPNEGKSTIAVALAQLSAHSGARVILVDCDLRNPSLSRELVPDAAVGLIEVAVGSASLEEAILTDPSTKLSFLPVVTKSRLIHTNEILASPTLKQLFDRLRDSFDYVIVDLSPVAPVVDVRSTADLVDSYVFIVEWGKTKIDIVHHAIGAGRNVYDKLLGVVLNKVDFKQLRRYEGYHGDYYYNRHYARYGYVD